MGQLKVTYMNGLVRRVIADEETVDYFANSWPCFYQGASGMRAGTLPPIIADFEGSGALVDLAGDTLPGDDPVILYDETGMRCLVDDLYDFANKWEELNKDRVPQEGLHEETWPSHDFGDWRDRGGRFEGEEL